VTRFLLLAGRLLRKSPSDCAWALWMAAWIAAGACVVRLTSVPRALRLLVKRPRGRNPWSAATVERRIEILDALVDAWKRSPLPVSPTCWERALVLQRILASGGVRSDVVLGVRASARGPEGHAWLERDGEPVHEARAVDYRPIYRAAALVFVFVLAFAGGAAAQAPPAVEYSLTLANERVTLAAKDKPTREILLDLQKRLELPIRFSAAVGAQRISADWVRVPLDTALRRLAPQVFVDSLHDGAHPDGRRQAIHLTAADEPPPPTPGERAGAMILSGAVDDTGEPIDAPPAPEPRDPDDGPLLRVAFDTDRISVKAREQPAAVILAEIAVAAGVPFTPRGGFDPQPISVAFSGAPPEMLPGLIPVPGVAVLVRHDLGGAPSRLLEVRYGVAGR